MKFLSLSLRFTILLSIGVDLVAQEAPTTPLAAEQTQKSPGAQCLEPPPIVRLEDYNGPFAKLVGTLGRNLDRKTVHPPHYKPGAILCSLEPGSKFMLFVHDSIDPVNVLTAAFNAGLNQAGNQDPSFGQGGRGYGKRFGAELAGQTAGRLFGDFLYPTVFSQDPRYYRAGHGSARSRVVHAMRHTVIAHRDNGTEMFNFTEWLGTASSLALNDLYHPGNQRGLAPAARNGAFSVLQDMGLDVMREFWPEIARKFKMPFRGGGEGQAALHD